MDYQLAQLNIARFTKPAEHPDNADFVNNLDRVNAIAESQPGFVWRLIGAGLAALLLFTAPRSETVKQALYEANTAIIDGWQRLSPPDEPSGKVVVVGIDAPAIREIGRWPWGRQDLAELVNAIADARPKSISLDILLSEPGVYSQRRLFDVFKQNVAEAKALLQVDPDAELAAALARAPSAVAVIVTT